ncbi:hypothetical protein ACFVYD_10965 [Streptomyces sp. NPDC058301]|uniref:hypothetical protein n=1 Tax=Streptomyces sp. NPDC058301 TaxID=3346436 RepID=UPI0036E8D4E9
MAQLRRPAPDGVVELVSCRRTRTGGTGTSALRRVRPLARTEAFVWLPVAAAEDLTPRQLRAYALIVSAGQVRHALSEAELAAGLFHHSGRKAGQALTVTAAGVIVDELETARWVTLLRRAGPHGRHHYIPHDSPLDTVSPSAPGQDAHRNSPQRAGNGPKKATSPPVGEGSGSLAGEGSLANNESPRTDRLEDARAPSSPAVGDVQVVHLPGVADNAAANRGSDHLSGVPQRTDGSSARTAAHSAKHDSRGAASPWPLATVTPEIYTVLEPVHWLVRQVDNSFVLHEIAREIARQLQSGMEQERLRHRLELRFARTTTADIRDVGRWLLGVALPHWGCGLFDCEAGTMWSTGRSCVLCTEAAVERRRTYGPGRSGGVESATRSVPGAFPDGEGEAAPRPLATVAPRQWDDRPRGTCGGCGARIFLMGRALADGLCKLCREELAALAQEEEFRLAEPVPPAACPGADGLACGCIAQAGRTVCARHRAREAAMADHLVG